MGKFPRFVWFIGCFRLMCDFGRIGNSWFICAIGLIGSISISRHISASSCIRINGLIFTSVIDGLINLINASAFIRAFSSIRCFSSLSLCIRSIDMRGV